jgi:transposase
LIRGGAPEWKPEHRIAADRSLRYLSDLTGAEWAVLPPARPGGRKRTIDVREILNGIFYVLWTGCQWQALPKDLPPKSTVWAYFNLWTWDARWSASITRSMWPYASRRDGRRARPRIIDSQSVKGAQKGGLCSTRGASMRQEDHGSQAPYPRRYARPVVERSGPSRQYSGSRGVALVVNRRTRRFVPASLVMVAIKGRKPRRLRPRPVTGQSRSSNACPPPLDSKSYLNAGSSNAPLPGSAGSAA